MKQSLPLIQEEAKQVSNKSGKKIETYTFHVGLNLFAYGIVMKQKEGFLPSTIQDNA